MKETKEKVKGITLIALVITIILLLILAGITITQLIGRGLFGNAKKAKEISDYTSAKEIVQMKLMETQVECIKEENEYTIVEIAKSTALDEGITIEKYYNSETALIKQEVTENLVNLKGIVVSVNQYSKYKFLIGEECKIEGVTTGKIPEIKDDYQKVEDFEREKFGEKIEIAEEIKVDINILDDANKFSETIQDQKKLEYIINNSEVFMDKILENQEICKILFEDDEAMNLIIDNDIWRNKILVSNSDSDIINNLDSSNPINLPTTNLELYDPVNKIGNVMYSSYLRNSATHSPINAFIGGSPGGSDWETESNGLPAYIGYDFGENNNVWVYKVYVQPGNNTAPTKMYLQSSNDNLMWETIYEFTQYTSPVNYTTEIINSEKNNKKSRYWRLYITESTGGNYVDLLKIQFYGK